MPISCYKTVAMVNSSPQSQRAAVIKRIVPACTNNCSRCYAQYWLIVQIQIVAIVPIVAVYTSRTGADGNIRPFCSIVAHKYPIIVIPGMIMVHEGDSTLRNRFAAVVRAMHERSRGVMREATCLCSPGNNRVYIRL